MTAAPIGSFVSIIAVCGIIDVLRLIAGINAVRRVYHAQVAGAGLSAPCGLRSHLRTGNASGPSIRSTLTQTGNARAHYEHGCIGRGDHPRPLGAQVKDSQHEFSLG